MKYIYYIENKRVESFTDEQKQKYTDAIMHSFGMKRVENNEGMEKKEKQGATC